MKYFHDFARCKKSINKTLLKNFVGVPLPENAKTAIIPEPVKSIEVQSRTSILSL